MNRHGIEPAKRPARSKKAAAFDTFTTRTFRATAFLAAVMASAWLIRLLFL